MIRPRLIVITDTSTAPLGLLEERIARCCALAHAGTVMIQLRDLDLPPRERLRLGERLVEIARDTKQLFVVNDRIDLALVLGADGIHLGESGVDCSDARMLLNQGAQVPWISRAWHDPRIDPAPGADGYLLSPIVAARKERAAWGLLSLAQAKARLVKILGTQLFALGGVDAITAASCIEAGADGVAVIGAVLKVDDPKPLLAALGIGNAS